jgi:hypothetical protein
MVAQIWTPGPVGDVGVVGMWKCWRMKKEENSGGRGEWCLTAAFRLRVGIRRGDIEEDLKGIVYLKLGKRK